jgi:hypothetical protein
LGRRTIFVPEALPLTFACLTRNIGSEWAGGSEGGREHGTVQYGLQFLLSFGFLGFFWGFFFRIGKFCIGREGGSAQYRNDVRTLASRRPVSACLRETPQYSSGYVWCRPQHPRGSDLCSRSRILNQAKLCGKKKNGLLSPFWESGNRRRAINCVLFCFAYSSPARK